jgi:hypothetical protein
MEYLVPYKILEGVGPQYMPLSVSWQWNCVAGRGTGARIGAVLCSGRCKTGGPVGAGASSHREFGYAQVFAALLCVHRSYRVC